MLQSRVLAGAAVAALCVSTAPAGAATPLVAIIDSGIARTAELGPLLVGEVDDAATPPRPAFHPRYDHGTMVATILARATGRKVRILSFRIDDPAGCPAGAVPPCQPDGAPIARAARTAAAMGAVAINISLDLKNDPAIVSAIHDVAQRGVTVVMAAGNHGLDHPANLGMARAGYPQAVLVGALDAQGKPWAGTNRPANNPDPAYRYAWQLGVDVATAGRTGGTLYGTGTSFAAPIETARLLTAAAATSAHGQVRTAAAALEPRARPALPLLEIGRPRAAA